MAQLNIFLEAALKQENFDYKLMTSASLVGSRGDEGTITKALKG
jgi:hypothetical protein